MKKALIAALILAAATTACTNSSNAPLRQLADTYAEMADNEAKMSEAFQAVYKSTDKNEQQALMEKATALAEEVKASNEQLAKKAKEIAEPLVGSEIKCEASPSTGITDPHATFTTIDAQEHLANVVISITYPDASAEKPYAMLYDADKNLIMKTPVTVADDHVSVNYRIAARAKQGSEGIRMLGSIASIMLVTKAEYDSGNISTENAVAGNKAEEQPVAEEPTTEPEPEPAYEGTSNQAPTTNNSLVGANLVKTLRDAGQSVSYEYNADSGIWATIGNIAIVISEDDLSDKGLKIINALTSDIEPNVPLTPDCFKASATVTNVEAQ